MTLEKRHLIGPEDIKAFEFKCMNESCGLTIRVPAERGSNLVEYCPNCHKQWFNSSEANSTGSYKAMVSFMDSRRDLERLKKDAACSIKIEIGCVE